MFARGLRVLAHRERVRAELLRLAATSLASPEAQRRWDRAMRDKALAAKRAYWASRGRVLRRLRRRQREGGR